LSSLPEGNAEAMDLEVGQIEAMVFDVDGTLIDSAYEHTLAWASAFAEVGVQVPSWWIHRHVGMGGDHLVEAVAGEDVERRLGDRVRELEKGRYQELIDEVQPFPAAKELLATCREAGLRVILASSAKGEELEHYLGLLNAHEHAHDWTSAPDVQHTKPDPDLIEVALEKAGTRAAVMVGDSVWDVVAATRAEIPTLGLLTGGVGRCELEEAGAVAVFESLEELQDSLGASLLPSLEASTRMS
jgi:HAD superfamily hydrolase (TIGR01549 family)